MQNRAARLIQANRLFKIKWLKQLGLFSLTKGRQEENVHVLRYVCVKYTQICITSNVNIYTYIQYVVYVGEEMLTAQAQEQMEISNKYSFENSILVGWIGGPIYIETF